MYIIPPVMIVEVRYWIASNMSRLQHDHGILIPDLEDVEKCQDQKTARVRGSYSYLKDQMIEGYRWNRNERSTFLRNLITSTLR